MNWDLAAATAMVWEIAGAVLTVERFVEVRSDQGLVARIAAWVLAHRLEHTEQCSFARPEKVTFQSSRSILLQGFERSWAA